MQCDSCDDSVKKARVTIKAQAAALMPRQPFATVLCRGADSSPDYNCQVGVSKNQGP